MSAMKQISLIRNPLISEFQRDIIINIIFNYFNDASLIIDTAKMLHQM